MEILIRAGQFFLSLLLLVLIHELGHFLLAKLFKVRVDKFYIFFNPWFSLFKIKIGETEYGIGWLPLGGYTKIGGMVDESFDREQMKTPRASDFIQHPAWQRLLIICGGVIMNLLLAWAIYSGMLYSNGVQYLASSDVEYGIAPTALGREVGFVAGDRPVSVNGEPVEVFSELYSKMALTPDAIVEVQRGDSTRYVRIGREHLPAILAGDLLFSVRYPMVLAQVLPESPASRAGLAVGDSIVEVNGSEGAYFDAFQDSLAARRGDTLTFDIIRGGASTTVTCAVPDTGLLGIQIFSDIDRFYPLRKREYSLAQSVPAGFTHGIATLSTYVKSLGMLFVPEAQAHRSLGGFITVAKIFPSEWVWALFWQMTALLSIILAVMNILPIPGLDGGHALFILYEMIFRRRPSEAFLSRAIMIGFALIVMLALYANLNDIIRLFN